MNSLSSLYQTTSSIPIQMTHIDVVKKYLDRQLSYDQYDCFPDNYLVELHKVTLSDSFLWLTIERANELIKESLDYGEITTPNRVLGTLCLENLVDEINNSSLFSAVNEIKFQEIIESFFQWFKKHVDLSDYFLRESYVSFHPKRYMRTLVVDKKEGDCVTIYTIGWKPGQGTEPHNHGNDRDAILVLDGCLTQYLYDSKEPSESASPVKQTFSKEEIIFVEPNRCHKLVNENSLDLKTLHIRVEDKCHDLQEGFESRYTEDIYGDPFWNNQQACFLDGVRHLKQNLCS
jgi:predicted metal-dependent enzyme (double-stranded beta helix superfamily)